MRYICWFFVVAGALIAAWPAVAGTIIFEDNGTTSLTTVASSPYDSALVAQTLSLPYTSKETSETNTAIVTVQLAAILAIVLVFLRSVPSAMTVLRLVNHALAAALAKPRTRSIMARSPFDL